MLDPNAKAFDASSDSETLPDRAFAPRQRAPEGCHPLKGIHRILDKVCTQSSMTVAAHAGGRVDTRVIRAAVLQSLYSFGCNGLFLEQLRYNTLYRWFVGLDDDEQTWSDASYADALNGILSSSECAAMLRTATIRAHACAALTPNRFRIDRALVERWTCVSGESAAHEATVQPATIDPSRARLDRAFDIIQRRIGDFDLTPESIAAEMCMSRRALFLLFEKHGLTPTRLIRDLRLDHCHSLLADARHRRRKITDIAMDFGFAHPPTFSREFKDRFGVSPVEIRIGARKGRTQTRVARSPSYIEATGAA